MTAASGASAAKPAEPAGGGAALTSEWTVETPADAVSQKCLMVVQEIEDNFSMYYNTPADMMPVVDAAREWLMTHWEDDLHDCDGYCLPDIVWMAVAHCLVVDASARPAVLRARETLGGACATVVATTRSSLLRMPSTATQKDDLKKLSRLPEPRAWTELAVYMLRRLRLAMIGFNHPFRIPGTCDELKAERERQRAAFVDVKNAENINYAKHVAKRAVPDADDGSATVHPTERPVKYPSDRNADELGTVACRVIDAVPDDDLEVYCAVLLTDEKCPVYRPEFVSICSRYFMWTRFHRTFFASFQAKDAAWRHDTDVLTAQLKRHAIGTKRVNPTATYQTNYEAFLTGMFAPMGGRMHCIRHSHGDRKQLQARPYYQMAKVLNELEPSNLLTDSIAEPIRSWAGSDEIRAANDEKTIHHDVELFFRAVDNLDQYVQVRRKSDGAPSTVLCEYVYLPDDVFDRRVELRTEHKYKQGAVVARPKMAFQGGKFFVLERGKYRTECKGFFDTYCCWVQLIRDQYDGTLEEKSSLAKYLRDIGRGDDDDDL